MPDPADIVARANGVVLSSPQLRFARPGRPVVSLNAGAPGHLVAARSGEHGNERERRPADDIAAGG
jgi:hypothetical protein